MGRRVSATSIRWALLLMALLVGASGCGRSATVTGKVTYQGRPVTHGSVVFLASDRTARSGVIEADGTYKVEGVRAGLVKIGVISSDPSKGRSAGRASQTAAKGKEAPTGKATSGDWFPLPRTLENPETSGLSYTVGSGSVKYDIELK